MMSQGLGPGGRFISLWDRKGKRTTRAARDAMAKTNSPRGELHIAGVLARVGCGLGGIYMGSNFIVCRM